MSAVYRITEKKCATCRFWNGDRRPEFRGNRLFQVKVAGSAAPCMAKANATTPACYCPRWQVAPGLIV